MFRQSVNDLSDKQKEEITRLRENGLSVEKIFASTGISTNVLRNYYKKNNITSQLKHINKSNDAKISDLIVETLTMMLKDPALKQASPDCKLNNVTRILETLIKIKR